MPKIDAARSSLDVLTTTAGNAKKSVSFDAKLKDSEPPAKRSSSPYPSSLPRPPSSKAATATQTK